MSHSVGRHAVLLSEILYELASGIRELGHGRNPGLWLSAADRNGRREHCHPVGHPIVTRPRCYVKRRQARFQKFPADGNFPSSDRAHRRANLARSCFKQMPNSLLIRSVSQHPPWTCRSFRGEGLASSRATAETLPHMSIGAKAASSVSDPGISGFDGTLPQFGFIKRVGTPGRFPSEANSAAAREGGIRGTKCVLIFEAVWALRVNFAVRCRDGGASFG
ncbi:hypothetical protein Fuma_00936 [Fuerstiella marisgermanici]|uniref:Uncharacterized protein n=1 Tax=Fuerstiella marisgermanici TaxID=1891926 RepID=A0A1P8WBA7_9PLAN|nr:hypothetical protein Fuma_00936 [Fuerstiella marisgermanici]